MSATWNPSMRNPLPMERSRPSDPPAAHNKTPDRLAVEHALRAGTVANPLSSDQIAARSGVALAQARVHIYNTVSHGHAHNTAPGQQPALYAWGAPLPKASGHAQPRIPASISPGDYAGAELRPFDGRPGAMVAFSLPSLVDGQRVPRRAPVIIGGRGEVR